MEKEMRPLILQHLTCQNEDSWIKQESHIKTSQLKGLWALTVTWVVKTVHLLLDRRPHICKFSTFPPKITPSGWGWGVSLIFSSPELKAKVSFSDRLSSVCLSVNSLHIFIFFSTTTGPLLINLGTTHPWMVLIRFFCFKWWVLPFSKGDN